MVGCEIVSGGESGTEQEHKLRSGSPAPKKCSLLWRNGIGIWQDPPGGLRTGLRPEDIGMRWGSWMVLCLHKEGSLHPNSYE
jgi:hypothetical protein